MYSTTNTVFIAKPIAKSKENYNYSLVGASKSEQGEGKNHYMKKCKRGANSRNTRKKQLSDPVLLIDNTEYPSLMTEWTTEIIFVRASDKLFQSLDKQNDKY